MHCTDLDDDGSPTYNVVDVTLRAGRRAAPPGPRAHRDDLERVRRLRVRHHRRGAHDQPVCRGRGPRRRSTRRCCAGLPGPPACAGSRCSTAPAGCTPRRLATPEGELLVVREDVGRHNAVDKVVGAARPRPRAARSPGTVLVVSAGPASRSSRRRASAGIPVVVAVGAASSLAVELATAGRHHARRVRPAAAPLGLQPSRPAARSGLTDRSAGYRPVASTQLGERRRSGERCQETRPASRRRRQRVIGERTSAWPPAKTSDPSSTASRASSRTSTPTRRRSGSTVPRRGHRRPRPDPGPLRHAASCSSGRAQMQVGVPSLTATDYINTISPEQEPWFPGDEEVERALPRLPALERRDHGAPRAAARHRRRRPHLDLRVGRDAVRGRASTTSSAARTTRAAATRSSSRATPPPACTPAPSSRAGSAEDRLDGFRQEKSPRRRRRDRWRCPSYPHPRLMPRLLGVPDGVDGHRPDERDLPGAVQQVPAQPRHQGHQRSSTCGRSSATARWTSPSRAACCSSRPTRSSTTSPSSSTATCSGSTARCAATARSSRSSRRSSAAPAGTSSRSSGAAAGTRCSPPTATAPWCT